MKLSQGCTDRLQVAMKILEIKMKHFLAWKRKGPLITVWEATDNTSLIVTNSQGTVIDYTLEILNDSQSDTLGHWSRESACEKNRQVARTNSNFSSFKEKKKKASVCENWTVMDRANRFVLIDSHVVSDSRDLRRNHSRRCFNYLNRTCVLWARLSPVFSRFEQLFSSLLLLLKLNEWIAGNKHVSRLRTSRKQWNDTLRVKKFICFKTWIL